MKTTNIILALIVVLAIAGQSCSKEYSRIEGMGAITTQSLDIESFSSILIEGSDNVDIHYGPVQKVEVTGHPNIISRIKTEVRNGLWDMGLENGNYGNYELSYTLTLPRLSGVEIAGSSNVSLQDSLASDEFELLILGSGSFFGFGCNAADSYIELIGSGNCEITSTKRMDVIIEGSGSVFYKGNPSITTDITGSGRIVDAN